LFVLEADVGADQFVDVRGLTQTEYILYHVFRVLLLLFDTELLFVSNVRCAKFVRESGLY